nr:winged helix-turn-helix domain-containing protein [Nocardia bovistercoris]
MTDADNARPVYLRIADALRQRYTPGGQLPSTPKLAEEWGVARETIRAAIDVLRTDELVTSSPGRGVFYAADRAPADPANDIGQVVARLDEVLNRLDSIENRLSLLESEPRKASD